MVEIKNVRGVVLTPLMWQGMILSPKTEYNFSLTRRQYNNLKDKVIKFNTDFDFSDDEIVIEEPVIEDIALDIIEKHIEIENSVLDEETIEETESEKDEDEIVADLISKRDEIEQIKEKEREITYEREQVNKARPIPTSIKKKTIKK